MALPPWSKGLTHALPLVGCAMAGLAGAVLSPFVPLAAGFQSAVAFCAISLAGASLFQLVRLREKRLIRAPLSAMRVAALERLDGNLMASLPDTQLSELAAIADLLDHLLTRQVGEDEGLHSMHMAMVGIAPSGEIVVVNHAAVRLFGYQNQGELVLEDAQVLLPAEEDRAWCLAGQGPMEGVRRETIGIRADGGAFQVELELVERNARHVLLHCTDITAKKAIEAAMQQARDTALQTADLQSQFLANMSHEIRTPVNGILGMAQLLLDGGELQGEALENAQIIQSCGQTLLTLINDILDLSKLDAGKVTLEPRETNLRRVVQEVVTLMEPRADDRGNCLEIDYPFHAAIPLHAVVDGVRLRQVLLNLVGNAVKFTENGSICVRVRCCKESDRLGTFYIEVEDTGVGIAADKLEQIFERFVQAEASTTRKFGGTGLGLPITKQLTELMGGSIAVESSEYGTLFRVALPLPLAQPAAEVVPSGGTVASSSLEGLRVLVAEDNPVNQKITSRMLGKMGCEVKLVENGADAADAVLAGDFDLVLMDCMMPGVDGYEGTRRIRMAEAGTGHHLPVIALTARAMEGDRERCLEAGMDDYLTKPFSVASLQGLMQRWLRASASGSEADRASRTA